MRFFPIPHTPYPIPLLLFAAVLPALADGTININNPSAGTGWTFSGNVVTITANGNYTVTGSSTTNRIVINKDVTATITLNNANIHSATASPFSLSSDDTGGSDVTLILSGTNELVTTNGGSAGLTVTDSARITIQGSGSLFAQGAGNNPNGGAGIGGGGYSSTGTINITGGTVYASGGLVGAGIGGGTHGGGGNITITGGTITAIGGFAGAGIGGGFLGNVGNVTVTGGTITAHGGQQAAGIGEGYQGDGGNIIINGGTINVTGGQYGAGIGGGENASGGNITVTGGTINVTGGERAAGIGAGYKARDSNITVTGGTITAMGGTFGAGIGGGEGSTGGGNITVTGGMITATGQRSAGIGGGYGKDGGNITIEGGSVIAIGSATSAGIGGGENGSGGNIVIRGGVTVAVTPGGWGDPAAIGGGGYGNAGTVNITGGTVYASSGTGAGIGGGVDATGGIINITGGTVIADEIGIGHGSGTTATHISGASTLVLSQSINTESFGEATVLTGSAVNVSNYMTSGDGSDVILNTGLTVPSGCTLVVPVGIVFNVNYKKINNNGVIREYGTIKNANQRLGNPVTGAIQQDWITISAQTYTGNPIEPAVTISYGSLTLAQGVDYSVACTNNVNAGTATATITDWGDNHTISAPFTIARKPVAAEWLTVPAQPYTGSALTPAVTVTDGSRTLTLNKDYTVACPVPAATNAGTYEVGITGMGNYTGSASKPFTITPKALASGGIAALPAQTYTGVTIEPAVTVTDGDKELEEDKDYTVAYTNNVNAGTATATATGAGNYGGTISKDFTINPKALSAGAIQEISAQVWTGDSVRPAVVVRDGSRTLTPGVDYTITYNNNVQAGEGMATITGRGNYAGSAVGYFDILSGEIASGWILDIPAQTYTGKAIEPAVTVRNGSKTLTADTDYTITYSKNVQAGVATVRVTGWGNYTGNAYGYFDILPREIAVEWIEDVPAQTWTGRAITPAVTVRDGDRTLTSGTDYTVTYANNVNVGPEAWVSVTGMGNYAGTQSKKFSIVSPPTDTVPTPPPADTVSKAVTGVSFYNDSYIVEKGQTLQMVAVVVPADAGNRNVSWATSNRAVATVSGGRVTAVSAGEATITVTTADGGYRDACLIRVPGKVTTKDTVIYQKIIFYERDTLYRDTTVTLMDTLYTDTTVHRVDTLYRDTTLYITDTLYRDTTVCLTDTLYNDTIIYVANIVHADSIDYTLVPDTVYVATDITGAERAVTATARVVRVGTGLRIEGLTPGKTFGIYRVTGEKLYSGTAQSDVFRLDNIPAGVYILYHKGQYSKFSY
ncbi:MAG: Ig-like domain-containing protein [Bacteroidales bacterium]